MVSTQELCPVVVYADQDGENKRKRYLTVQAVKEAVSFQVVSSSVKNFV